MKIIGFNGENFIAEDKNNFTVLYFTGANKWEVMKHISKKEQPSFFQAAIAKWGYSALTPPLTVATLQDIDYYFCLKAWDHMYKGWTDYYADQKDVMLERFRGNK